MTIKFHSNTGLLILGRGIKFMCGDYGNGITLYSGTQPTAQQILDNWSTYTSNNANFLVHFKDNYWDQPNLGNLLNLSNMKSAIPLHSGLAKWCIMYTSNILEGQLQDAVIPNKDFLILPVTDVAGKGVIRLLDPNIVAGVSNIISAGSLSTNLF